jgi:hypothetical protein
MSRAPAALAALWIALGVSVVAGTPGALAKTQLQTNQAAARADAIQHLRGVRLPSDARRLTTEPRFAKSFAIGTGPGLKYQADDDAFWSTTAGADAIIAYARAHAPAGSTAELGSGSGTDSKTGVRSVDIQFSWPDLGRKVFNRSLTLTVVTPRHGRSVVLAQTQSSWFVPRPATEVLPSGVHAVVITLRLGPSASGPIVKSGPVHTSAYVVWRNARVRSLVSEVDGLPTIQPGAEPIACPMMLTGSEASELTLAFMTGRHGATLARVQVSIHRGQTWDDGGGPCNPIEFWIAAKQQTALTSATFVKQVGKLIGADIS